ncbi:MAG: hypothetical protein ACOYKA_04195 [Legionellaceae bacterium]
MGTMVILVVLASIIIFFSEELSKIFKKIIKIKGASLILPLLFASWVVVHYDARLSYALLAMQRYLHQFILSFAQAFPFKWGAVSIVTFFFLTSFSALPAYVFYEVAVRKKMRHAEYWVSLTYALLWLVLMFFLMA